MIHDPLYPHGRLSGPISQPGSTHGVRRDLIEKLRAIRRQGQTDMIGIERHDPDFSVKLSTCTKESEALAMLDKWLARRLSILNLTREHLHQAWTQEVASADRARE